MDKPLRLPPSLNEGDSIVHLGGTVDVFSVCLRIWGDDLNPDEISTLMQATPTSAHRKGDIDRSGMYDRIEDVGKWHFDLDRDPSATLNDLVDRLLNSLTADLAIWQALKQRYHLDVFCGLRMEHWNRGTSLLPQTMIRLGERGLELGLDIYYVVKK